MSSIKSSQVWLLRNLGHRSGVAGPLKPKNKKVCLGAETEDPATRSAAVVAGAATAHAPRAFQHAVFSLGCRHERQKPVRCGQVRQRDVDQSRDPVAIELEVNRGRNVAVFARADLLGGLLGPADIDGPELCPERANCGAFGAHCQPSQVTPGLQEGSGRPVVGVCRDTAARSVGVDGKAATRRAVLSYIGGFVAAVETAAPSSRGRPRCPAGDWIVQGIVPQGANFGRR